MERPAKPHAPEQPCPRKADVDNSILLIYPTPNYLMPQVYAYTPRSPLGPRHLQYAGSLMVPTWGNRAVSHPPNPHRHTLYKSHGDGDTHISALKCLQVETQVHARHTPALVPGHSHIHTRTHAKGKPAFQIQTQHAFLSGSQESGFQAATTSVNVLQMLKLLRWARAPGFCRAWLGAGSSYPQSLPDFAWEFPSGPQTRISDSFPLLILVSKLSWGPTTDSSLPCALGMATTTGENQAQKGSHLPSGGWLTSTSLPPAPGLVCCLG